MEEVAGAKEVITEKEEKTGSEEIFTKIVRAGKRTYFFDVKATKRDDYYLTITESKKRPGRDGKIYYEKHKIFLYKEDFDKFCEGLREAVDYIDNGIVNGIGIQLNKEPHAETELVTEKPEFTTSEFTNVDFDDLGKK